MKDLLLKQIQFEHWANTELHKTMLQAKPLDDRALLLFSHLLSSGSMWLSRVTGQPITTILFQERTLAECAQLMNTNHTQWLQYLKDADETELNRIVEFIFPIDGTKKRMSVHDAIFHIVHHSSYHRGQIITKLKGTVATLPLVTYIVFASERVD